MDKENSQIKKGSKMNNVRDKVIVITGASSGIGEASALKLAEGGAKLILGARREDRLQNLVAKINDMDGKAFYKVTDVTKEKDLTDLAQFAVDKFGKIDVLLNNAGIMPMGHFSKRKVKDWDKMIDVNIKGVLYGISAVLPHMEQVCKGHIINVSSVAGHKIMPTGTVYCATKHAVRVISEGLRMEMGDKIRSTIISPGAVETELPNSINDEDVMNKFGELFSKMKILKSEDIANAVYYAIEQPDHVDINEILVRPTEQEL